MPLPQIVSDKDVPTEFVADFVNTQADGAGHLEFFGTPGDLRAWALRRRLPMGDEVVTESDLVAARELREALRTVLLDHAGDPELDDARRRAAEEYLNQAGARYPLNVVVASGKVGLRPRAEGVPGVLGTVMAAIVQAAQAGEWSKVKACVSPVCHFAFVDQTRNHSGRFCCASCASRVNMRAHRERNRQG